MSDNTLNPMESKKNEGLSERDKMMLLWGALIGFCIGSALAILIII